MEKNMGGFQSGKAQLAASSSSSESCPVRGKALGVSSSVRGDAQQLSTVALRNTRTPSTPTLTT
jgi:hypothetical protein